MEVEGEKGIISFQFNQYFDLSLPVSVQEEQVQAFYLPKAEFVPVKVGSFVEKALKSVELKSIRALIIRTLPNTDQKTKKVHSGKNPVYVTPDAASFINQQGITHLLLDLPSVDREEDEGMMASHKAFFGWDSTVTEITSDFPGFHSTVTELCYIPNQVQDGMYLLDLQISPFECDAAPSRPILYPISVRDKN